MVGGVAVNLRSYSRQTNLYPAQRFCFWSKVKLLQQQKDIVSFLLCDKSRTLVALILQSFIFFAQRKRLFFVTDKFCQLSSLFRRSLSLQQEFFLSINKTMDRLSARVIQLECLLHVSQHFFTGNMPMLGFFHFARDIQMKTMQTIVAQGKPNKTLKIYSRF